MADEHREQRPAPPVFNVRKTLKALWPTVREVMSVMIYDYFLAVEVPQELVIKNVRLGLLYKILQAMALIALFCYAMVIRIWTEEIAPRPFSLSAWPRQVDTASGATPLYCAQPSSYSFNWVGQFYYRPDACRYQQWADGWIKEANRIFLATFIAEFNQLTLLNRTGECPTAEVECGVGNGQFINHTSLGTCECFRFNQYFVRDAENTPIQILHGFQVTLPDGFNDASFVQWTDNANTDTKYITTHIQDQSGNPCLVNGVSTIEAADISDSGISGSLREWMACAGVEMDYGPSELGGNPEDLARLRLMGFQMTFQLQYSSTGGDAVQCIITPRVSPVWTNVYGTERSYGDIAMNDKVYNQARVMHGVFVHFEVTGGLRYFDLSKLVSGFVNILFLMTVPKIVMHFICLYMMGMMSHIYRNAKRTQFSIRDQLRIAIAKALMPNMVFRGLVGGEYRRRADLLPEISAEEMKRHVADVFKNEMGHHDIEDRHVNRMVMMLCEMGDGKFKELLKMRDFENLCNTNEVISNRVLVDMLHWKRRRWLLEKILDNTDRSLDAKTFQSLKEDTHGLVAARSSTQEVIGVQQADRITVLGEQVARLRKRVVQMEENAHMAHNQVEEMLSKANAAHERAELAELLVKQYAEKATAERSKEARRRAKEKGEKDAGQVEEEEAEATEKSEMQLLEEMVTATEQLSKKAVDDSHAAVYHMEVIFDKLSRMGASPATSGAGSPTSRRE